MKGFSLFYFSAMAAITMEQCMTRYILVNIGDAKERANSLKSNRSVDLLRELNVDKDNRRQSEGVIVTSHGNSADSPHCSYSLNGCEYTDATKQECATGLCRAQGYTRATFLSASNNYCRSSFQSEKAYFYVLGTGKVIYGDYPNDAQITAKCYSDWLHFLHVKTNWYMGNPVEVLTISGFDVGDRANIIVPHKSPGEHTICDINGNSLKLSDVKTGMMVKIRAKHVHWPGYDYLYTADGVWGNIWYDKLREIGTAAHDKQTWIVKIDPSDSTFSFETTYWKKGNYLIGPEKWNTDTEFLWCDDDGGGVNKWTVTPSSL